MFRITAKSKRKYILVEVQIIVSLLSRESKLFSHELLDFVSQSSSIHLYDKVPFSSDFINGYPGKAALHTIET